MRAAENVVSKFLKAGLLLVPILPLFVSRSLFFPFITGKNFAFRVLIEILLVLWVWLMLKNRDWRPRKSFIVWAVGATLAILILSTIFGVWSYKAMWSSFERMEGLWAHLHYFTFFLMLGSVFKSREDWRHFFFVSLGASVVMSFYGLAQLLGRLEIHQGGVRLDGTMGNATYLAIYLVFHVFPFAYFFFQTEKRRLRAVFAAAMLFELFIVYHTATRGAIFGIIAGLILFALINLVWGQGRVRKAAAVLLAIVIIVPAIFIGAKNTRLIKENEVLSRFANISLEETTTQSRFIIWGMAFDAWKERPVLGWGPESFVYIFSKEYKSELWRQEPWFDRAHNVLFDWLSAAGLVGLVVYLNIFTAALFCIWRLFKSNIFKSTTAGIFVGLLAAYFVHNLFVFDNFTSYILFFSVLAFLHWQYVNSHQLPVTGYQKNYPPLLRPIVTTVTAIAVIFSVYVYNVKPILAAKSIIDALRVVTYSRNEERTRDLNLGVEMLKKGIALNTFGTIEIREQLAQYAERIRSDSATPDENKLMFINFALEEMKKQAERFPFDIRAKIFLASLYSFAGEHEQAISVVNEAIKISPQRQQFYFLLGEIQFRAGDEDLALETMKQAYELDPENPGAVHNYAVVAIFNNQQQFAENLLRERFGKIFFPDRRYINAYAAVGNLEKLTATWQALVEQEPENFEYRLGLTSAYLKTFQDEKAIGELREAIELNEAFRAQGEAFISQIRNGTILR